MFQFFYRRVIISKSLFFVLIYGIFLSLYHVKEEMIPNLQWLDAGLVKGYGVDFTPYSEWFEFGVSNITTIFFITLPILSSLPFADTFAKDRQTGYFNSIFSKGKIRDYFSGLYLANFVTAGIVVIIPLIINVYFAFMLFPNIMPDPIINNRFNLNHSNTFFPELYYSQPLLHISLYIFLSFLYAGMYATISLSISFLVHNRFVILVSSFIIQLILTLLFQSIGEYGWVPSVFLREYSFGTVSFPVTSILFFGGMLISTVLYIWGVKKRVVL